MSISLTDSPMVVGDLELKNRVWLAPLTRGRCGRDQVPKSHNVAYYTQRASAGMLITEATAISPQGMGWSGCAAIYSPAHVEGWKKVTDSVHAAGGKIVCQLWHMGRVTHSAFHGLQPVAPSAVKAEGQCWIPGKKKADYEAPRALELAEIPAVIEEYRHAAECAKAAGFDGVEIHGANGYLLDQFLQTCTNKREDAYGGPKENRFRLLREVIAAVATVFPASRIGVRLSPNGAFNGMGSVDAIELFSYVISELDKVGLMYLHCMDGLAFGFHAKAEVFRASRMRSLFRGPLVGNCGYTKEAAEAVVNAGALDAVAFGRAFIPNPDLVERFRKGAKLAECSNMGLFYEAPGDDPDAPEVQAVGYSDWPAMA